MDDKKELFNKPISEVTVGLLDKVTDRKDPILFTIVGDMSLTGRYEETALSVSGQCFYVVDSAHEGGVLVFRHQDVSKSYVKRMYGNAFLIVEDRDGHKIKAFRFTYAVAALCDMAAAFIERMGNGGRLEEELPLAQDAFEKNLLTCPKCGRALLHTGAECIHCQSKGKIISKLMPYIRPEKGLLLFCMFLSALTMALTLVSPYLTKVLVDDIIPSNNKQMLWFVVLGLLGTYLVTLVIGCLRGYLLRISGERILASLRNDVYRKAQFLSMKFYDKTSTGAVINRISGDTATLQAFMLRITQEVVVQFFLLIGIVIVMFLMDWRLTLLSLMPVPLVVVGTKIFSRKIAPYYRRFWRRWASVSSILTDTIPCIRIIKSFASEERAIKKFNRQTDELLKVNLQAAKISTIFPNTVNFVITCGSLLIWSVGGSWVIDSGGTMLSVGMLVSFLSYTSMFYTPVNFFAYLSDSYQAALSSAERVLDILDAEAESDACKGNCPQPIQGKIEFRNVNFSFDRAKKVLSDINLTIEPGEIVGIVGTTGSGKSTMINLLMRFYDHYEGEILLDGHNIRDIDMQYYRSLIGYVQQEPMMFSDTIYNNISYGVPDAHVEQVIAAAEIANAHEFIVRQPDGYDSMLGERGVGLSGGEKQRLSIARAVLTNPSLLIFDEATAAVDSETENQIQEAIDRLISGRTTLMIAHRLSTLRKANRIIVVDQGRIIENGSHDELMALKGKYYRLIKIQSMSDQLRRDKETENLE